jgi:hypothetical protein
MLREDDRSNSAPRMQEAAAAVTAAVIAQGWEVAALAKA